MSGGELLQLRLHFGERDRNGGGPLDAAVMDACARRGVRAAALLRGAEGFGAKQRLRTDRLLSLSEDTPLIAMAVGEVEAIEVLASEVREMAGEGLMVLEEVDAWEEREGRRPATGTTGTNSAVEVAVPVIDGADVRGRTADDVVKATIWGPRTGPRSPHLDVVAAMRRRGTDAATVLLGVDGVLEGERRRARFVAANRGVPAMTVAVGERAAIEAALAAIDGAAPLVTVESAGVERNRRIATESHHGEGEERNSVIDRLSHHGSGSGDGEAAARVTLVTAESAQCGAHPLYVALIHALRREGAPGATALRGVWGFRGDREPHGDRVLALRRDVPIVVEVVDAPDRAARWRDLAADLAGAADAVHSQAIRRSFTLG